MDKLKYIGIPLSEGSVCATASCASPRSNSSVNINSLVNAVSGISKMKASVLGVEPVEPCLIEKKDFSIDKLEEGVEAEGAVSTDAMKPTCIAM